MTSYKQFSAAALKASSDGSAEAVIATTGQDGPIDADGDVVQPGAIGTQVVPILPAHDWSSIWLGKAFTRESGNKVVADLRFNMDVPEARSWHSALAFDIARGPSVAEYSWGYTAVTATPERVGGRMVRLLKRVRLHEISMVVRAASFGTRTVSVKCESCDGSACDGDCSSKTSLAPSDHAQLVAIKSRVDARMVNDHARLLKDRFDARAALERTRDVLAFKYRETPPPVLCHAAYLVIFAAAAELGVAAPPVKFFKPVASSEPGAFDFTHPSDIDGAVRSGEIWIRDGLSRKRMIEVAAHEVRHLAPGGDEPAAAAFGRRWAGRG